MRFHTTVSLAGFILALCWCASAAADDVSGAETAAQAAAGGEPSLSADRVSGDPDGAKPWGGSEANTLNLSLQEAIGLGIQNNLGVKVQRFDPLISEEETNVAWGSYDPVWNSEIGWDERRTPSSSSFDVGNAVNTRKVLDGQGGITGVLPLLSTQYSAILSSDRTTTNFAFQTLSPEYTATVTFSLKQPLLRGLIWNEPWTRVKVSNIGYQTSLEAFRRDVMDIVSGIETAYWNLIATHEQMLVAEKSLETSRALLGQTRIQYEVGVVSKVDVVQAEAGVADREFSLIKNTNRYRQAQDDLIDQVLGEQLRPETTLAIQPTDEAKQYIVHDVDVLESTRVAFASRPELQIASREIERMLIQEKFAKNQRLPQFDLEGRYAYRGLSGRQNDDNNPCLFNTTDPRCDPTDPAFDPSALAAPRQSYGDAYDKYFDSDGANNWTFRGVFSIPIPNTAARARARQAGIELRRARTQKRRVEQDIILEIRTAARNIEAAQEGIEAALRAVAAAEEQLRAEEIRLEYGESTPFDVLLREEDLVESESQRIAAYQAYRTSLTALDRRQGTILRNRNIAIDAVLSVR
ncbi:MAG: TolC family protein [Myxococcota bacterium]